jgi:hypothetical protein
MYRFIIERWIYVPHVSKFRFPGCIHVPIRVVIDSVIVGCNRLRNDDRFVLGSQGLAGLFFSAPLSLDCSLTLAVFLLVDVLETLLTTEKN